MLALIVVVVAPFNVPLIMGLIVALLGTTLGVLGGNPVTRRILEIATHGRVRDGATAGSSWMPKRPVSRSPRRRSPKPIRHPAR